MVWAMIGELCKNLNTGAFMMCLKRMGTYTKTINVPIQNVQCMRVLNMLLMMCTRKRMQMSLKLI